MKWINIFLLTLFCLIPTALIQAHESSYPNLYEVKPNDTLPTIAKAFQTTTEDLKVWNGLQSEELIAGQKLWVPVVHEVLPGETLQEIAKMYHSTVDIIKNINKLQSDIVKPGKIIAIQPKKMKMQGQHILMTREEFGDWLANQALTRKINLIQQHHTWQPSYKHFDGHNHFQLLMGMQNFHIKTMGWDNIAQHITTFPDGTVAVSRPFNIAPEGTIGTIANKNGIAIENLGNFDHGHDVMTEKQKQTIIDITALLSMKFNLTPSIDTITYHHWWHYRTKERVLDNAKDNEVKSCPGTNFFGGNSTKSAERYFYPLVKQRIAELQSAYKVINKQ